MKKLLLIIFALLLCSNAWATTYYIAPLDYDPTPADNAACAAGTGGCLTLQYLLDNASISGGDTIELRAATEGGTIVHREYDVEWDGTDVGTSWSSYITLKCRDGDTCRWEHGQDIADQCEGAQSGTWCYDATNDYWFCDLDGADPCGDTTQAWEPTGTGYTSGVWLDGNPGMMTCNETDYGERSIGLDSYRGGAGTYERSVKDFFRINTGTDESTDNPDDTWDEIIVVPRRTESGVDKHNFLLRFMHDSGSSDEDTTNFYVKITGITFRYTAQNSLSIGHSTALSVQLDITNGSNYITVDNCTFERGQQLVRIANSASNITIQRSVFREVINQHYLSICTEDAGDIDASFFGVNFANAILVYGATNVTIQNSTFNGKTTLENGEGDEPDGASRWSGPLIEARPDTTYTPAHYTTNLNILDNNIQYAHISGIRIMYPTSDTSVEPDHDLNALIKGNYIAHIGVRYNDSDGIGIGGGYWSDDNDPTNNECPINITVTKNRITDFGHTGVFFADCQGEDSEISYNVIWDGNFDNSFEAISGADHRWIAGVVSSWGAVAKYNTIYDISCNGNYCDDYATGIVVIACGAADAEYVDECNVSNNIIDTINDGGVTSPSVRGGWGIRCTSDAETSYDYSNNIIFNLDDSGLSATCYTCTSCASVSEVDPQFMSSTNLKPKSTSPAIDSGNAASSEELYISGWEDAAGNTAACGSALDIGAYEFCKSGIPPVPFRFLMSSPKLPYYASTVPSDYAVIVDSEYVKVGGEYITVQ